LVAAWTVIEMWVYYQQRNEILRLLKEFGLISNPTQSLIQWVTWTVIGEVWCKVPLTTPYHLVPRLGISGAIFRYPIRSVSPDYFLVEN
jgi:hypothetical protein